MGVRGRIPPAPREYVSVFKPTDEDFHPSYALAVSSHHFPTVEVAPLQKLVDVKFIELPPYKKQPPMWRVSVWGADDTAMENDIPDRDTAWAMFVKVISWTKISRDALKNEGFINV